MAKSILDAVRNKLRKNEDLHEAVNQVGTQFSLTPSERLDLLVYFLEDAA